MTPPRLANTMLRSKTVARVAKAAAGVDQRRSLPAFSERPLRARGASVPTDVDVWIWADSFTDRFASETGRAALELLESMGLTRGRHPRARLLRADLDHHRPARPPPGGSSGRPSRRCTATSPAAPR